MGVVALGLQGLGFEGCGHGFGGAILQSCGAAILLRLGLLICLLYTVEEVTT